MLTISHEPLFVCTTTGLLQFYFSACTVTETTKKKHNKAKYVVAETEAKLEEEGIPNVSVAVYTSAAIIIKCFKKVAMAILSVSGTFSSSRNGNSSSSFWLDGYY